MWSIDLMKSLEKHFWNDDYIITTPIVELSEKFSVRYLVILIVIFQNEKRKRNNFRFFSCKHWPFSCFERRRVAKAEEEIISKTNVRHASKICVMPYSLIFFSKNRVVVVQESIHDLCTYNNSLDFPWIDY